MIQGTRVQFLEAQNRNRLRRFGDVLRVTVERPPCCTLFSEASDG